MPFPVDYCRPNEQPAQHSTESFARSAHLLLIAVIRLGAEGGGCEWAEYGGGGRQLLMIIILQND